MLMLSKWEEIIVLIHYSPCQSLHNAFSKYTTYNLKVSHPRCVVKIQVREEILFCTVTKHN